MKVTRINPYPLNPYPISICQQRVRCPNLLLASRDGFLHQLGKDTWKEKMGHGFHFHVGHVARCRRCRQCAGDIYFNGRGWKARERRSVRRIFLDEKSRSKSGTWRARWGVGATYLCSYVRVKNVSW